VHANRIHVNTDDGLLAAVHQSGRVPPPQKPVDVRYPLLHMNVIIV
jgi:hypothetical protein